MAKLDATRPGKTMHPLLRDVPHHLLLRRLHTFRLNTPPPPLFVFVIVWCEGGHPGIYILETAYGDGWQAMYILGC